MFVTIDRGNPDLMGYLLPGYLSIATGCLLTAKLYQPGFRRLGAFLGVVFLLATIGRLDFRLGKCCSTICGTIVLRGRARWGVGDESLFIVVLDLVLARRSAIDLMSWFCFVVV